MKIRELGFAELREFRCCTGTNSMSGTNYGVGLMGNAESILNSFQMLFKFTISHGGQFFLSRKWEKLQRFWPNITHCIHSKTNKFKVIHRKLRQKRALYHNWTQLAVLLSGQVTLMTGKADIRSTITTCNDKIKLIGFVIKIHWWPKSANKHKKTWITAQHIHHVWHFYRQGFHNTVCHQYMLTCKASYLLFTISK